MYDEIVTKVLISKPQYLAKDTQCLMLLLIWTFVHHLNRKFKNNNSELSVFIFWETGYGDRNTANPQNIMRFISNLCNRFAL